MIRDYRKTFRRLATTWYTDGLITDAQRTDIVATLTSNSWKIWRPLLYAIPRSPIESAGRLKTVPMSQRAAYGGEYQIDALDRAEFDLIEVGA